MPVSKAKKPKRCPRRPDVEDNDAASTSKKKKSDTTSIDLVSLQDSTISTPMLTTVKFKELISVATTATEGLQQFLKEAADPVTGKPTEDIVYSYCASSPEFDDIIRLFPDSENQSLSPKQAELVYRTITLLVVTLENRLNSLAQLTVKLIHFLETKILSLVTAIHKAKKQPSLALSAIELLTLLTERAPASVRNVNFTVTCFELSDQKMTRQDVRVAFTNFIMTLLMSSPNESLIECIVDNNECLVQFVLSHIDDYSGGLATQVLAYIDEKVAHLPGLNKAQRSSLFSHQVVSRMIDVFLWNSKMFRSPEMLPSIKSHTFSILLTLFTSKEFGIGKYDQNWGHSKCENIHIMTVLTNSELLQNVYENQHLKNLVSSMLSSQPDILKYYVVGFVEMMKKKPREQVEQQAGWMITLDHLVQLYYGLPLPHAAVVFSPLVTVDHMMKASLCLLFPPPTVFNKVCGIQFRKKFDSFNVVPTEKLDCEYARLGLILLIAERTLQCIQADIPETDLPAAVTDAWKSELCRKAKDMLVPIDFLMRLWKEISITRFMMKAEVSGKIALRIVKILNAYCKLDPTEFLRHSNTIESLLLGVRKLPDTNRELISELSLEIRGMFFELPSETVQHILVTDNTMGLLIPELQPSHEEGDEDGSAVMEQTVNLVYQVLLDTKWLEHCEWELEAWLPKIRVPGVPVPCPGLVEFQKNMLFKLLKGMPAAIDGYNEILEELQDVSPEAEIRRVKAAPYSIVVLIALHEYSSSMTSDTMSELDMLSIRKYLNSAFIQIILHQDHPVTLCKDLIETLTPESGLHDLMGLCELVAARSESDELQLESESLADTLALLNTLPESWPHTHMGLRYTPELFVRQGLLVLWYFRKPDQLKSVLDDVKKHLEKLDRMMVLEQVLTSGFIRYWLFRELNEATNEGKEKATLLTDLGCNLLSDVSEKLPESLLTILKGVSAYLVSVLVEIDSKEKWSENGIMARVLYILELLLKHLPNKELPKLMTVYCNMVQQYDKIPADHDSIFTYLTQYRPMLKESLTFLLEELSLKIDERHLGRYFDLAHNLHEDRNFKKPHWNLLSENPSLISVKIFKWLFSSEKNGADARKSLLHAVAHSPSESTIKVFRSICESDKDLKSLGLTEKVVSTFDVKLQKLLLVDNIGENSNYIVLLHKIVTSHSHLRSQERMIKYAKCWKKSHDQLALHPSLLQTCAESMSQCGAEFLPTIVKLMRLYKFIPSKLYEVLEKHPNADITGKLWKAVEECCSTRVTDTEFLLLLNYMCSPGNPYFQSSHIEDIFLTIYKHKDFESALFNDSPTKFAMVTLLNTVFTAEDRVRVSKLSSPNLFRNVLSAYNATLSQCDQLLLECLYAMETSDRFKSTLCRPFVWGTVGRNYYKSQSEQSHHLVAENLATNTILNCIDTDRLKFSAYRFPLGRYLISGSRLYKATDEEEKLYDPVFMLPVLSFLLRTEHQLDVLQLLSEHIGTYLICALSSSNQDIRSAARFALAEFQAQLENSHVAESVQSIYVLNMLTESIQTENGRLNTTAAIFFSETLTLSTEEREYAAVWRFLLRNPTLQLNSADIFRQLFNKHTVQVFSTRTWILKICIKGLRTMDDCHSYIDISKMAMHHAISSMCIIQNRKLILELVLKTCNYLPSTQALMKTGLLGWLSTMALRYGYVGASLQIMSAVQKTLMSLANKREHKEHTTRLLSTLIQMLRLNNLIGELEVGLLLEMLIDGLKHCETKNNSGNLYLSKGDVSKLETLCSPDQQDLYDRLVTLVNQ